MKKKSDDFKVGDRVRFVKILEDDVEHGWSVESGMEIGETYTVIWVDEDFIKVDTGNGAFEYVFDKECFEKVIE